MLSDIKNLTLIGAGKMGMALARGWLDGGLQTSALNLVDPAPHASIQALAADREIYLSDKPKDGTAGVILLAVKPQVLTEVVASIKSHIGPDTLVLSIVAGVSIEKLCAMTGTQRVVRTMPNTPAQVGKGVTGLVRGPAVSDHDWQVAKALYSTSGLVVELPDEADIDALTVVSGSGPAYVFHLVEAMAAAGVAEGLDADTAMILARQTVIGAAALMEQDPTDAGTLRQNVTSPKGVTAEALDVLMDAETGMPPLFQKALNIARKRSEELGK